MQHTYTQTDTIYKQLMKNKNDNTKYNVVPLLREKETMIQRKNKQNSNI